MSDTVKMQSTRDGFGEAILQLGKQDDRIVVLTADLTESLRVEGFAKTFPHRFIQCGVAEQNMMGIAAGLALSGKIPFVCSYAVFSPGRSWDQLRVSVCYSNANVKIIGGHTGLSVGPDGATHQALEDIAITRVLPNLTVVVPADSEQAKQATLAIAKHEGPAYLRLTRDPSPTLISQRNSFKLGSAQVVREGNDLTCIVCGPLISQALTVADLFHQQGISVEIINVHTIKPIDAHTLITSARKTHKVVTLEDHQIMGGMGSVVCEVLSEAYPVPVLRLGMQDTFGQSGKPEDLYTHYGLDSASLMTRMQEWMQFI